MIELKRTEVRAPESDAWPDEHCANEPGGFFPCGERNALWALGARLALVLLLLVTALPAPAAVRAVGAIGLTVGDFEPELESYTQVLPFEKILVSQSAPGDADELLGLSDTQLRSAELALGDERITLCEHVSHTGRPIPPDSRSYDHWFQHIAIVVSDMDRTLAFYRDLLGLRVAGGAENYGVEQEYLNQVFGARVRITSLRVERGPGIEFLEYITPPGGRPLPADANANNLVFWHTRLDIDGLDDFAAAMRERKARFVSARVAPLPDDVSKAARSVILRDPDGHALQFIEPASSDRGNGALTSKAR